jgi:hypothetical protein
MEWDDAATTDPVAEADPLPEAEQPGPETAQPSHEKSIGAGAGYAPEAVDPLAEKVNSAHAAAKASARDALAHAIACGGLLASAKGRLNHGEWLPWLRDRCPEISERMAQNYMRLHDRRADLKSETGFVFETIKHALARLKRPRSKAVVKAHGSAIKQPREATAAAETERKVPATATTTPFDRAEAAAVHRALEEFFKTFQPVVESFAISNPTTSDCDAIYALVRAAADKLHALTEKMPADHHESADYKHLGFKAFCTADN